METDMTGNELTVPPIALGTWAWGDSGMPGDGYFGSVLSEASLQELVDKALTNGFTLWDTAVVYGDGRAETVLGRALRAHDRSGYQLSTKFTPQVAGEGDDAVAKMLEQSLDRMGSEYVDFYWIHNPSDVARWTPHLIPLLESGRVRHVGVSNHNLAQITLANQILNERGFGVEAVQNHYSLLHRSSERVGILDQCRERRMPFFAYMVLEQGALTGSYGPGSPLPEGTNRADAYNDLLPRMQGLIDLMKTLGSARGATAAAVAMTWAIGKGAIPIVGVTKPDHVDALIAARDMMLTEEEVSELETLADSAGVVTKGWWEQEM